MRKLLTQDLASVLVEKHGVAKQEALQFVTAMFDVIQEGLNNDKIVKVKGFGTFKVIEVDARESVNVNTGDRVLIDSHSKISFTPDASMKELVNKPFSGFQTVVLNDGVNFEDIKEEWAVSAEVIAPVKEVQVTEPAPVEEVLEEESTPTEVVIEEPAQVEEVLEEPVREETSAEAPVEEDQPAETSVEAEKPAETPVEETQRDQAVFAPVVGLSFDEKENSGRSGGHHGRRSRMRRLFWPILLAVGCCLSFIGGYFVQRLLTPDVYVKEVDTVFVDENTDPADDIFSTAKPSLASVKAAYKAETEKPSADTATQVKTELPQEMKPVQSQEEDYRKYEQMDFRVKTGAYRIVGTDTIIRSVAGETLLMITNRTLGPGMSCYLEVYNNIKSPKERLEEGTMIRIPKLVEKKKLKSSKTQNKKRE